MYDNAEKRKYLRIEKPYMARFRVNPYENSGAVSTDWDMVQLMTWELEVFSLIPVTI